MAHDGQKEVQKASLIGKILSTEFFLLFMGIALLVYGITNETTMVIFWACVIIPGAIILHFVRKRDWAKHWEEMEAEHKALEAREAMRREAAAAQKADNGK